ncbi:Eco57I restriction-modification methylase domain-containing protein [Hallerella porci]|uniref:site-specific DNA-methyltransferase (adenine-specific) n=1 Tax=Hallerella porci TaxID=1945871 RepID=A0ABX5LPX0_9BACT|nr:N-6 DNA methylase [Hallerella porci]PWL03308.1 TaqI restriction endonuclease [Hallerella porci]
MFTNNEFRNLFQNAFDLEAWKRLMVNYFDVQTTLKNPELLEDDSKDYKAYYLGKTETSDGYSLGFFKYDMKSSIDKRKVGLRKLVKSYLKYEVDAALVVFNDNNHWRLSFICDIKGEETAPKRYTYVFGEKENYYNTSVARFIKLQSDGISFKSIKEAFAVEALTKQFYNDLFAWYLWANDVKSNVSFPNDTNIEDDDREKLDVKIIRLITRLMFVWFIKQKKLVPNCIFDETYLTSILKNFDPESTTDGTYYNAILQNLFFATLNRAIVDEEGNKRGFATNQGYRDVKTLYRYAELFNISESEVIKLFSEVPFLNGGLFECQDKTIKLDGVEKSYNFDGFSRNSEKFRDGRFKWRAVVPNILFFEKEKGLLSILNRYNFTIEENSPNEQQVALDPELLGKVFENLLGAYNPETQETARKESGSFYTPREVVNYMVDESLQAYLGDSPVVKSVFDDDFEKDSNSENEYKAIATKLQAIKILDPACGSGAFPMGLLNRMVDILQKIHPQKSVYDLKLSIIENCIYGSDIQCIAAQISKLRFFISLICDCEKDATKPNFGIPTLPNLETHFVAADSLLSMKKQKNQIELFEDPEIEPTKQKLKEIRHEHFSAKSAAEKMRLRKEDTELRNKLAKLLIKNQSFAPDDAKQLAGWNPYDQNAVAEFLDPSWMFGVNDGFDIVIGNPPYVQLQNNGGALAKQYEKESYKVFAKTGDIYCLFYERGAQLLKPHGHLCFITSNKWMRAGYGEKTREYFTTQTNPKLLVDFAGVKVFESATVDTNILLFEKAKNEHKTICAVTSKENKDSIKNLSVFLSQNFSVNSFNGSDSWVILSPIEQSIKAKIEKVGTPLKDWDINIYRGVLTGCNEAFIISTEKRNEILENCKNEDERKRTAELIRPILRGRDIKRYSYDWANLWLVYIPWHFPLHLDNSIQGCSEKAEKEFQKQYPAIYNHLLGYKKQLSARNKVETGIRYEWYALQRWGANYWEDFSRPKLIYPNMTKYLPFVYDDKKFLTNQKCFIVTGKDIEFLTAFLNSSIFKYCFRDAFPELLGGTRELSKIFFDKIPVLQVTDKTNEKFKVLIKDIQNEYTEQKAKEIDKQIFELYGLNEGEIYAITK